tara:strand:+ start:371 stop:523 length:153 start_codon:yes stop_codon:yes gene_type:complete
MQKLTIEREAVNPPPPASGLDKKQTQRLHKALRLDIMVGDTGLEPVTSGM